jgi:hypothetical protein
VKEYARVNVGMQKQYPIQPEDEHKSTWVLLLLVDIEKTFSKSQTRFNEISKVSIDERCLRTRVTDGQNTDSSTSKPAIWH